MFGNGHESRDKDNQINGQSSHRFNHHRHYHSNAGWTLGSIFIAAVIIIPIVLIASLLKLTVGAAHIATKSMVTTGLVAPGVGISSSLAFSTALGIGAFCVYGMIGCTYLYFSAKKCYSGDNDVFNLIKSLVVNEDGLSFTGVLKSAGAVLWSPFLLLGGLTGMGVKVAVQFYKSKFSTENKEVEFEEISTSHSKMQDLGHQTTKQTVLDSIPAHTSLFYDPEETQSLPIEPTHHLVPEAPAF